MGKSDPISRAHFWYPSPLFSRRGHAARSVSVPGGSSGSGFDDEWGPVMPSKISHLLPHVFEERLLRIYTRETDKNR